MRFTSFIVAGLAAVASALPASQVSDNFKQVTTMSRELQTPAKNLAVLDGPLLLTGQGNFPTIIQGFTEIINTINAYLVQMNPESYTGADAELVFDSFRTFTQVHQELLNLLIGKADLFSTVPFIGQPVAAILRADEGSVDSLLFSVIDMLDTQAMEAKDSADALSSTFDTAINSYSGLSL